MNKNRLRTVSLLFFVLLFVLAGQSQNTIGIPTIVNYTNQTYNAGSQNWDIAQDKNGILYFANNQGLLTFDGAFWRKYSLPNKTIVRSVVIDSDGRIYVGGQSEFGYFFPDKKGELVYTSLLPLVEEKGKDFTDVWNICIYQNRIFFRAYRKILEYDRKKIKVHDGVHWSFLGSSSANEMLAFEFNRKLVAFKNGQWVAAGKNFQFPTGVNIRSAISIGQDSTLLTTLTDGLYILHHDSIIPFVTKDIAAITGQNVYGATLLDDDRIALITNLSGCIVINKKGEFIQRLSKREGIQNNNVLSVFLDKDKNLWLGLSNGIDLVVYSNAIQQIFPEAEDRNAGYASIIHHNKLYLGLASGAYQVPLANDKDLSYTHGTFELVKGSKGQVWNFSVVNEKLLIGHNSGAFIVNDDGTSALDAKTGFWDFQPVKISGSPHAMLAGTYNGINFYNADGNLFSNPKIHAHFESARFVVQHQNTIWIAHPYKGLYMVRYENSAPVVSLYQDKQKFLSNNHNKLFKVWNKMMLTSDNGIFEFDDKKGDFVRSVQFEKLLNGRIVSYLKEDPYGNVWFTSDKKIGVLDKGANSYRIVFIPELNNKIQADGFENISIIDSNNVIITGERGFYHLNYAQYKKTRYPLRVMISNVRAISPTDSLFYGGYAPHSSMPSISYAFNSLHFETSTTLYGQESTIEYSYYLEGFDNGWSEWTKKTEKDYTNIPPGNYQLLVKCRNNFDNESHITSFSFTVLPPWYRTWWVYFMYGVLVATVLYFFYKKQQQKYIRRQQVKLQEQQRKYDEEQKRLQMLHQLTLSENEKKITQLQKEKLQAEVEHKNAELASSAMNLVHKAEILSKLKDDLLRFKETAQMANGTKEFQKIIKVIDGELDHAQEWEQFAVHFDNVHSNYLKKLKANFPELTTSELKLAAYLRLNLSTKEIAQLLNISVRGVETSRYRLRKKLGLTNEDANLYGFLMEVTK